MSLSSDEMDDSIGCSGTGCLYVIIDSFTDVLTHANELHK